MTRPLHLYHKYFTWKLFFVALLIFTVLAMQTLDKPLTVDEATFGTSWKAMHEDGISALSQTDDSSTFHKNIVYQLAHPPLWRILVFLYTLIFGMSNVAIRSFGIITYFITLILIYKILREFDNTSADKLTMLTASILLIHPFLAIESMAVHIDTQLLPVSLLLFTLYFIRNDNPEFKNYMLLGSLYAFSLWSKELLAAFLSISLFIYYILQKDFKGAIYKTALISSIGIILFSITWFIVSQIFGIPFEGWFIETIWNKVINLGFQKSATSILTYGLLIVTRSIWKITFYNIAFLALTLLSIIYYFINRPTLNRRFDFIYVFGIVQFFFFFTYFWENTYYLFSSLILSAIMITILIYQRKLTMDKKGIYVLGALTIFFLLFKNPAIKLQRYWLLSEQAGSVFIPGLAISIVVYLILYYLPFVLVTLAAIFKKIKLNTYLVSLVILFLSMSFAFNAYQLQDHATAVLWNNYGEKGFVETQEYLENNLIANSTIITRKDFEYYLIERFDEENITYIYNKFMRYKSATSFQREFSKLDFDDVTMITTDMYTQPRNYHIMQNFSKVFESGDFAVYVKE